MRRIIKDKLIGENFLIKAGASLFLLGFLLLSAFPAAAQVTGDPCDYAAWYPASSSVAQLRDANENVLGSSNFDILRNGEMSIDAGVYPPAPEPDNTVYAVILNNVQIATLFKGADHGREFWNWGTLADEPREIARVGDVMKITRNGQLYASGKFIRYAYNWAFVLGSTSHETPPGFQTLCSITSAVVYLPNSQYPRRLAVYNVVQTTSPVTRITINGPSILPGGVGPEVADVPLLPPGASIPLPPGWMSTYAENLDIRLTEVQYQQLKQGLLTVNVFTENEPNGFSQMPLGVYYINAGGDYEGDGQADLAVFRPNEQMWYLLYSSNNQFQAIPFGLASDKLVVGDFDHDGKSDITAFQVDNPDYPNLGVWKIRKSTDDSTVAIQWGLNGDIPLAMDIDGNNTSDLVVFRPSNGTWYIQKMGDIIKPRSDTSQNVSRFRTIQWGAAGDKPLAGDFNADGRDDIVVFRPSEGNWYIYDDFNKNYRIVHWGASGDIPMARDFDGDAKADFAVYRPSEGKWYILSSIFDTILIRQFGLNGDIPVPSDFDKDGVSDIAVFRPSDGTWYITRSSDNTFYAAQFGVDGDIPAMAYR
ncbi:MAG TPA: VCBS repeat-containing protein [Pyrinomonadaceae bacterium]|jgi:hypothetical protein